MNKEEIDTSIGGNANEYTERGFGVYGRVTDFERNTIRVQRSSRCGEPLCHVFTKDLQGHGHVPCVGAHGGRIAVTPLLTAPQARELATALLAFANDVEGCNE